ncbi:hypothetical protein E0K93_16360 [Puniceibacterium sp. HSS470]|nr:hypothetical protein [Pseudooceanicola sediminis]KAA2312717.1 hypothetical protein E0K93_16360 [Puniceibacterium sp. HSS470]|tara:strand:- start:27575 stop:27976 length:402 start_codon:yes stop_codon:yes gene_type:complete
MTDTIDFPIEHATRKAIRFTILDTLDELPDAPGLYVLMGAEPGGTPRPLAFGHVDGKLSRHLPHQPEFAAALRQGFTFAAVAEPVPGCDSARLADQLGRAHDAPINAMQNALRDIEAAQLISVPNTMMPLAAE